MQELFSEILTSYIVKVGVKRKEKEVESSKKNRPCLKKMMTPPLAFGSTGEKMPDRITKENIQKSKKRKTS